MIPLTVTYRCTDRGFTFAEFRDREDKPVLTVQCSSAINYDGHPASSLRNTSGDEEPGTSGLWLKIEGPEVGGVSVSLTRRNVAQLATMLTRWLATGFVEDEPRQR